MARKRTGVSFHNSGGTCSSAKAKRGANEAPAVCGDCANDERPGFTFLVGCGSAKRGISSADWVGVHLKT